jgi:superfamily II DNA or RNA helicase
MRLLFDYGTLVLTGAPASMLDFAPGLVWDARVELLRAPAHRYFELVEALRRRGVPFSDEVASAARSVGAWKSIELRPYQQGALLSWEAAGGRGILVMPTGSGKTRVALAAMAGGGYRTLCLVPTRALLRQWLAELSAVYSGNIGCLGDGQHVIEPITVATFEGAYRYMAEVGNRFELLVVDEAHHFGVGVRDEALEMSIAERRLGLTATPPTDAALERLGELIGPISYQLSVADLAGTWLADFDLVLVRLGLDADERRRYAADRACFAALNRSFRELHPDGTWQDFVMAASQSAAGRQALAAWRRNRRLLAFTRGKARAVSALLQRHHASKVLVFTADNAAAYAIARQHLVMPMTCDISRTERERALAAFRRGELRTLVSSRVLNEGIDVPDAEVAIIVGGTLGEREHVQRVGRLLRPGVGKRAVVYDLVTTATSEVRRAFDRRRALVAGAA